MIASQDPLSWARYVWPLVGPGQFALVDMDYFWPEDQPYPSAQWSVDWFERIVDLLHEQTNTVEAELVVPLPDTADYFRSQPDTRKLLDAPGTVQAPPSLYLGSHPVLNARGGGEECFYPWEGSRLTRADTDVFVRVWVYPGSDGLPKPYSRAVHFLSHRPSAAQAEIIWNSDHWR